MFPAPAVVKLGPGVSAFGAQQLRPVFITAEGQLTLRPGGEATTNLVDKGEALYRMAEEIADASKSPLAGTSLKVRESLFAQVKTLLKTVEPGQSVPAGLTCDQALQIRASGWTVVLDLIDHSSEPELRQSLLAQFASLTQKETSPLLAETMAFQLGRSAAAQNKGPVRDLAQELIAQTTQVKPPYEKIFANGNKTLAMEWALGGAEFMSGFAQALKLDRFKPVGTDRVGNSVLERTYVEKGVETTFRITLRSSDDLLAPMAHKGVHLVGYEGHSRFGRTMLDSLLTAPDAPNGGEGMIIFFNLCSGQSALDKLRTKYPNAHIVTTVGSSEFSTDKESGAFTRSEGLNVLDKLMEGIAKRQDWAQIQEGIDQADAFSFRRYGNFISPASHQDRAKFVDSDQDGKADFYDKHFKVATFHVAANTQRELVPLQAERRADELAGLTVFAAARAVNYVSEMSVVFEKVNPAGDVVPGGWFEPTSEKDPIVRFVTDTRKTEKGKDRRQFVMTVNARYAHISEETLRAISVYEFARFAEGFTELDEVDRIEIKLGALLAVALSLNTDSSTRDEEIWSAILARYNLPLDLSLNDFNAARLKHGGKYYAGDQNSFRDLLKTLPPEVFERLARPGAGEPIALKPPKA